MKQQLRPTQEAVVEGELHGHITQTRVCTHTHTTDSWMNQSNKHTSRPINMYPANLYITPHPLSPIFACSPLFFFTCPFSSLHLSTTASLFPPAFIPHLLLPPFIPPSQGDIVGGQFTPQGRGLMNRSMITGCNYSVKWTVCCPVCAG